MINKNIIDEIEKLNISDELKKLLINFLEIETNNVSKQNQRFESVIREYLKQEDK